MTKSGMLTDNAINKIAEDSLQFRIYAETLEEIIGSSQTPLSVGLYGEWGSGKTSLMGLIQNLLERRKDIKTVWFDAWKFDKAHDLRIALIQTILKKMENDQDIKEEIKTKAKNLMSRVNWFGLGKATISIMAQVLSPYISFLPVLAQLLAKNKSATMDLAKLEIKDFLKEPDEKKTLELIGEFEDEFKKMTQEYVGKTGRLVVFVDDLDRCIPEKAIDILEAIKLFLNVPSSVFIVAADQNVIINGIMQKYGEKSTDWGRNYLEKIVQVPFRLPPLSKEVITKHFIQNLETSDAIKNYASILAEVGDNPRKIKRLLNTFELQRILAVKRGIKIEEMILAKLSVLEFRWPQFYLDLIDLYNESDVNLLKLLKAISISAEEERNNKLKSWGKISIYFNDRNLMGFLDREPQLFDLDLNNYVYLAQTTKGKSEDPRSFFDLGYASYEKKEYEKSIEYYTRAIISDPKYTAAYYNRALGYEGIGDDDRALAGYTKTIQVDSNYVKAYVGRGRLYHNKGDYDKAILDYNKAIEIDPNYSLARYNLGYTYEKKSDCQRAIENFTKAIELNPKYTLAYFERAYVSIETKEFDQAITDYGKVIELDPSYATAHNNRGWAYYQKGDYVAAITDCVRELELDCNHVKASINLEFFLKS